MVARWARAVLEVPYTLEVGRSVVDATLQIAVSYSLRPHIPIGVWALFKKQPSLPPICRGRSLGTTPEVIRHVRGLGDPGILKSYFLLIWSKWEYLSNNEIGAMEISIQEVFSGTGMGRHRIHLINHLDRVLRQSSGRTDHFKQQYVRLGRVLRDMERKAPVKARTSPRLTLFSA